MAHLRMSEDDLAMIEGDMCTGRLSDILFNGPLPLGRALTYTLARKAPRERETENIPCVLPRCRAAQIVIVLCDDLMSESG